MPKHKHNNLGQFRPRDQTRQVERNATPPKPNQLRPEQLYHGGGNPNDNGRQSVQRLYHYSQQPQDSRIEASNLSQSGVFQGIPKPGDAWQKATLNPNDDLCTHPFWQEPNQPRDVGQPSQDIPPSQQSSTDTSRQLQPLGSKQIKELSTSFKQQGDLLFQNNVEESNAYYRAGEKLYAFALTNSSLLDNRQLSEREKRELLSLWGDLAQDQTLISSIDRLQTAKQGELTSKKQRLELIAPFIPGKIQAKQIYEKNISLWNAIASNYRTLLERQKKQHLLDIEKNAPTILPITGRDREYVKNTLNEYDIQCNETLKSIEKEKRKISELEQSIEEYTILQKEIPLLEQDLKGYSDMAQNLEVARTPRDNDPRKAVKKLVKAKAEDQVLQQWPILQAAKDAGNLFIDLQNLISYKCNDTIYITNNEIRSLEEIDVSKTALRNSRKNSGKVLNKEKIVEAFKNITEAYEKSNSGRNIQCKLYHILDHTPMIYSGEEIKGVNKKGDEIVKKKPGTHVFDNASRFCRQFYREDTIEYIQLIHYIMGQRKRPPDNGKWIKLGDDQRWERRCRDGTDEWISKKTDA